jgi:hypothetical protein
MMAGDAVVVVVVRVGGGGAGGGVVGRCSHSICSYLALLIALARQQARMAPRTCATKQFHQSMWNLLRQSKKKQTISHFLTTHGHVLHALNLADNNSGFSLGSTMMMMMMMTMTTIMVTTMTTPKNYHYVDNNNYTDSADYNDEDNVCNLYRKSFPLNSLHVYFTWLEKKHKSYTTGKKFSKEKFERRRCQYCTWKKEMPSATPPIGPMLPLMKSTTSLWQPCNIQMKNSM